MPGRERPLQLPRTKPIAPTLRKNTPGVTENAFKKALANADDVRSWFRDAPVMELQGNFRSTVRNTLLLPFVNQTLATLETMADVKGSSDLLTYRDPLDTFCFKDFAVCITARNASGVAGKIIMNYDLTTALAIGNRVLAKMLGPVPPVTSLSEDIRGALAEFSNTVIGLATRELSENKIKITFGTPVYVLDAQDGAFLLDGVRQVLSVPIDLPDSGRFYFSYLLHNEA